MYDAEYDYIYDEDETHAIARCEECEELVYEDNECAYIDDEGNYFCCLQCALSYYSLRRVDNN